VPASNLLGSEPNRGFIQLMEQLPQERLIIAVQAVAAMEAAIRVTTEYVKERKAFGKTIFDFQNTRFKLAEAATEARIGRVFVDFCIEELVAGKLDVVHRRHVQMVDDAKAMRGGRRVPATLRRLWLHGGISDFDHVDRRACAEDLWRHQRDHEGIESRAAFDHHIRRKPMSEFVSLENRDNIAVIRVKNPPVNAISHGVRVGLVAALDRVAASDAQRWC